jgi:hypothetical protein
MGAKSKKVDDVAYGPYDDIVRGKWARGQQVADEITRRNFDYKGDDLAYEIVAAAAVRSKTATRLPTLSAKAWISTSTAPSATPVSSAGFRDGGATSLLQATIAMSRRHSSQLKTGSKQMQS